MTINRRSFVSGIGAFTAALSTWPLRASVNAQRDPAAAPPLTLPSIAVLDRHVEGSQRFRAVAKFSGLTALEFDRDVAGLWMRELEPRLRAGPVSIAGHTSAATLFCLDLLARDYGARTSQRVEGQTAVTWIISSSPGRRAPLAPAAVLWSDPNA